MTLSQYKADGKKFIYTAPGFDRDTGMPGDNEIILSASAALDICAMLTGTYELSDEYYSTSNTAPVVDKIVNVLAGSVSLSFTYDRSNSNEEYRNFRIAAITADDTEGYYIESTIYASGKTVMVVAESGLTYSSLLVRTDAAGAGALAKKAEELECDLSCALFGDLAYTMDTLKSVSAVFFVFSGINAVLLLIIVINFISLNVKERTKEIGIMRALGTSSGVTLKIFYIELALIDVITLIIATFAAVGAANIIDSFFMVFAIGTMRFVSFTFYDFIISAVVFTLFLVIVAYPILRRLGKKQPIDVIRSI